MMFRVMFKQNYGSDLHRNRRSEMTAPVRCCESVRTFVQTSGLQIPASLFPILHPICEPPYHGRFD